jgi:hypothetical protein
MENRRLSPAAIGAIVGALLLGLLLGITTGAADRLFGGPDPKVIASSSLESMRAQNRLVAFVARYVSVTSARTSRLGLTAERTLILPGDVRYEVDLSKLREQDVSWDAGSNTLTVRLPEVEVAGPEVDLAAAREYGQGGILGALTNVEGSLDDANRSSRRISGESCMPIETPHAISECIPPRCFHKGASARFASRSQHAVSMVALAMRWPRTGFISADTCPALSNFFPSTIGARNSRNVVQAVSVHSLL